MPFNNTDIAHSAYNSQYTPASVTDETRALASVPRLVSISKNIVSGLRRSLKKLSLILQFTEKYLQYKRSQ